MLLNIQTINGYAEQLREAVNEESVQAACVATMKLSSRRAARELTTASPTVVADILRMIEPMKAGRIAGYLPAAQLLAILDVSTPEVGLHILSHIPPDVAGQFFRSIADEERERLFALADPAKREEWGAVIDYEPDTVGAVMTTDFLVIAPDATVADALDTIASAPPEIEKSTYVYILNAENKLCGVASVRDLIRASRAELVETVMQKDLLVVKTADVAADAAKMLRNRRFAMLPVVDDRSSLVGVLTLDDAADILAIDVADQFSGMMGDLGDESFFTRPRGAIRRRLPWMAGNVFLNLLAVAVITGFEDTIAQVAILAAFLPMITDMGGNVGIQSLSVAIRSIALGEAQIRDVGKAIRKEVVVGLVNGVALGALFGVIALALQGNALLGFVAGTALGVNVVVAGVVGGCLPFLIKRLGKDPAMLTGPLLTTITDVTGVSIYLGLSTLFIVGLTAT